MKRPFGLLLLLLLLLSVACSGPVFDASRFAGTWTGELTEPRSGARLPITAEVTPDGDNLKVRLGVPGGAPETFVMEITTEAATLAETRSARFGTVQGSLTAAGELRAAGKDVAGPLAWFELEGTWGEELDARIDFALDIAAKFAPAAKARVTLRR
ncbi:MAG: hypothetical protein R3F29_10980 [Planctomycetota bacterium]